MTDDTMPAGALTVSGLRKLIRECVRAETASARTAAEGPEFLTFGEAARLSRENRAEVECAVHLGELPTVAKRPNSRGRTPKALIPRAALLAWMNREVQS